MKKGIIIVNTVWLFVGLITLITSLFLAHLGTPYSLIYSPKEYINGDAYNYMIEAAIRSGEMSMYAGSVVRNTIIGITGALIMFLSSCGLVKELSKGKKSVDIKQDNNENL